LIIYGGDHGRDRMVVRFTTTCAISAYHPGAYLRKIAPMASTKIACYIYYLIIISPGIHVYVYSMVFAKLLQENYLKNLFRTFPYGNIRR